MLHLSDSVPRLDVRNEVYEVVGVGDVVNEVMSGFSLYEPFVDVRVLVFVVK